MTDELQVVGMMALAAWIGGMVALAAWRKQRALAREAQALSPEALASMLVFSAAVAQCVASFQDMAEAINDVGRAFGRAGGRSRR